MLFLFAFSLLKSQESFLISFPKVDPITVCNGDGALQIKLDATSASTTGATVTVQLGTGIQYVPGSVTALATNAGLTISESNITNLNAPVFTVSPSNIAIGNSITIQIKRVGTCAARTFDLGGGDFSDTVSSSITGAATSVKTTPEYQLFYPVLSMTQPASQANAVLNTQYSRSFSISNGGTGCTTSLYLEINYPANGIQNVSLEVTSQNGVALATPIIITPTVSGTTYRYIIPASALPGGDLCGGEQITLTEKYKIKTCNAVTSYAAGSGCSSTLANWCQQVNGTGTVTMATGTPSFTRLNFKRSNFVNSCSPFNFQAQLTNGGTGDKNAAAMYNVVARFGGGNNPTLSGWYFNYMQLSNAKVGSASATVAASGTAANQILTVDLSNKFTTDPDGAGVGLDDLDGDGFYDDLPGNQTLNIDFTVNVNCSLYSCAAGEHNEVYGIYADMKYNTMCSATQQTSIKQTPAAGSDNLGGVQVSTLSNKSYVPANVNSNEPFRARFSVGYFNFAYALDTNKTRYVYEITLPAGISVSGTGNAKWYKGQYPDNQSSPLTPTVSQTGNTLTVTSPDSAMGYFVIDLVFTCGTGGSISIPFKLKRIDDAVSVPQCSCNPDIFCSTANIGNTYCPNPCAAGPSTSKVKVERADNSLGWTDNTLSTLQSRTNISPYDLSKALYLDDINVTTEGEQNTAASNLYLKLSVNKFNSTTDNKLTPKSITLTILRGGNPVGGGTVSAATITGSGTAPQVISWNLTSLLPAGGLLPGDKLTTVATYQVTSNNLPLQDTQTGNTTYFYNLNGATEQLCNSLVPEMYLVTAAFEDRHNGGTFLDASSCTSLNVGGGTNYLAYRFSAAGTQYINEIRPGFLPTKYTVTVPAGFTLDKVEMQDLYPAGATVDITSSLTNLGGGTYSYNLSPNKSYPITVTNQYSMQFRVYLKPKCDTPASGANLITSVDYIPQYYYYKKQATQPTVTFSKTLALTYNTLTKPAISLTNVTGPLQALKPVESFTIKLTSTGTTTAPYTWIAIPTVAGINIVSVTDLTTNTTLTPINYSDGKWYQLSAAGLATGVSNNYRIDFSYTSCTASSFNVIGGWNCSSFPTDPTAYNCGVSSVNLPFTPQPGQLQITKVTEPSSNVTMCQPINFAYRVVSAGGGGTVANKFLIRLPAGLTIVPGTLQAEYPLNSGNWSAVTTTNALNVYTMDLTTHPQYPTNGLPGTLNDGGNANLRQIGIRFQAQTSCSFKSGSSLRLSTTGNSTCGAAATGSGAVTFSAPVKIQGADSNYKVSTTVTTPSAFDNCANPVAIGIQQTIISSAPIAGNGEIDIEIPVGYTYSSITCSGTFCPTFHSTYTDPLTGTVYAKFKIPAGMNSGNQMNYTINLLPSATPAACGNYSMDINTYDNITGIMCGTTACSAILSDTGSYTFNYTVRKPDYSITAVSGSFNGNTYSGSVSVQNTSTLNATNPVKVTFYCADDAGVSTGQILGTYTFSSPIAAGATKTENFSVNGTACSASRRVVAVINGTDNCTCSAASNSSTVFCYKPSQTSGSVLDTNHGITALARAGANNSNWPMVRKGAWTVLESRTKGFVVNRLSDADIAALPAAQLKEGMMVYNTTQNCLMINTDGTATGWKCYNNQACPN